ncbi:hypothetical protein [Mesorhizobium sp.]|uniref:lipopolysaccharide biosynthesis protein n=1 Tax=Mesorhizobium sp. TaxID=1871066 RepID=UPI001227F166|nr:hypothetical protein [Mesorhizobium sp.]TIN11636.1 MAG: hypothetical protein E5Y14_04750 [Mesorhizobium sp.]
MDGSGFRKLVTSVLALSAGTAGGALAGLAALAVTARALDPDQLGTIVMAQAYAAVVGRVFGFSSWQIMVRHGRPPISQHDRVELGRLVGYCVRLDALGALSSVVVSLVGVSVFFVFDIVDVFSAPIFVIFCLTLAGKISGWAVGLLRLHERFAAVAAQGVSVQFIRVAMLSVAWALNAGLYWFVAIWAVTLFVTPLTSVFLALRICRSSNVPLSFSRPTTIDFAEAFKLFLHTNYHVALTSMRDLDVFILGTLMTPAASGLHRVARDIGLKPLQILNHIPLVLYPVLMRQRRQQSPDTVSFGLRVTLLGLGIASIYSLCMAFFIGFIVVWLFGSEYAPATILALIFLAALPLEAASKSLGAVLMADDKSQALARSTAAATVPYLCLVVIGALAQNLSIVVFSYFAQAAFQLALLAWAYRRQGKAS